MYFPDIDRISILAILEKFRNVCDSNDTQEKKALWPILYILKRLASSSLEVRSYLNKIRETGLHNKRILSYVEVVNYFITTFATDDIIAHTIKGLEFYNSCPEVSTALFARNLYIKAIVCWIVHEEEVVKLLFVQRLDESACANMGVCLEQPPRGPWQIWFVIPTRWARLAPAAAESVYCLRTGNRGRECSPTSFVLTQWCWVMTMIRWIGRICRQRRETIAMTTGANRVSPCRVAKCCITGSVWRRRTRFHSALMCQDVQICYKRRKIVFKLSAVPSGLIDCSLAGLLGASEEGTKEEDMVMHVKVGAIEKTGEEKTTFSSTESKSSAR